MSRREVRRRLRRLGDADSWRTGSAAEPPAVRAEDRPRALRRDVVVIAVVALLVVGGSAVVLSRVGSPAPAAPDEGSASAVPWISDSPSPTPTPTAAAAPACRPTDFAITATLEGTVMNQTQSPVTLVQRSGRACALRTGFVLESTRDAARVAVARLPIDEVAKPYSLTRDAGGGYRVPSGLRLVLRIDGAPRRGQDSVGAYDRPALLRIDGTAVRLPGGRLPANVVDHRVTLSADSPVDPQDAGDGPYSALRASIALPDALVAGSTAAYTVTLRNTGTDPFEFGSTCPAYEEALSVFPTVPETLGSRSDERHVLDCGGVRIAGGGSVSFAMRLPVPDAVGPARLGWFLDDGPSDAAPTSITR